MKTLKILTLFVCVSIGVFAQNAEKKTIDVTIGIEISLTELQKMDKIIVHPADVTITKFKISFMKEGYEKTLASDSEKLTEQMKKDLNSLSIGAKVFIEEILVKSSDGNIRYASPIVLKIK